MSRVKKIQNKQAEPKVKELYEKIEQNGARVLNLYRVAAHATDILPHFLRLGNSLLSRTELSPKLRELAILRVAKLDNSEYEWAQHYPVALEAGVTEEQTRAVSNWNSSEVFNAEERAVLQYVDEVTRNVQVEEGTFKSLAEHLNERCIVELTLSIGYWGMVARLLVPLQVEIDAEVAGSAGELTGRQS
jgi:alkylhydroperoxidase family enzyme